MHSSASHSRVLRLIALFKFLKSAALIFLGAMALKLVRGDAAETLRHLVYFTGVNSSGRLVDKALGSVSNLSPSRFKELGVGSFIYSGLFLIEGTGLWLQRRWAEWFTVVITGSLVPLEGYELYRHPTPVKAVMLLVNLGVVVYLIYNIKRSSAKEAGKTPHEFRRDASD